MPSPIDFFTLGDSPAAYVSPNADAEKPVEGYQQQRQNLLLNHSVWLKHLDYTCQFCGKRGIGKKMKREKTGKSTYARYAFHHTNSEAYGNEAAGVNYVLVCRECHWFVHLLGGELFLRAGAVRRQNKRAKKGGIRGLCGTFPNIPQRFFNWGCVYPGNLFGKLVSLSLKLISAILWCGLLYCFFLL